MNKRTILMIIYVLLVFGVVTVAAQEAATCPALVEQALQAMGDNCSGLERNEACYGYNRVLSTFAQAQPEGFFSMPADRAPLDSLSTIQTTPLDMTQQQWGIAVMSVQANVPNSLPGQNVIFLLLGDVTLNNDVPQDQALQPVTPITVTTGVRTELRSGPGLTASAVETVQAGTALQVDGVSTDGAWLRGSHNQTAIWVSRNAVQPVAGLDSLPTISADQHTPMQAFYFTTGIGAAGCAEADPVLAVQSPQNIQVSLTVNGVDIHVGSLVNFQSLADDMIRMTVIEGHVTTVDGRSIEAGQTIVGRVDKDGRIIGWAEQRPATDDELATGARTQSILATFGGGGGNIASTGCVPARHTVSPGDTLFSIARSYDTSMADIASANNITDLNRIFNGQQLVIPCPGSGFVSVPVPPVTERTQEAPQGVAGVDCTGFRPTSPLGTMPYGITPVYWDPPASGADQYRLNFYDANGNLKTNYMTKGNETNIPNVDTGGGLGSGDNFSWDVNALVGGQVVCTTARENVVRDRDTTPSAPPVTAPFTASWACSSPADVTVTWQNAQSGEAVVINFSDVLGLPFSFTGSGPSGSHTFALSGYNPQSGTVTATVSGTVISLPGPLTGCS